MNWINIYGEIEPTKPKLRLLLPDRLNSSALAIFFSLKSSPNNKFDFPTLLNWNSGRFELNAYVIPPKISSRAPKVNASYGCRKNWPKLLKVELYKLTLIT